MGNDDDRYAAAVEVYLTALKRNDTAVLSSYRSAVTSSPRYREISEFGWGSVAATGTLSLLSVSNDLPAADLTTMGANVRTYADSVLAMQNASGYPAPMSQYYWGSNSLVTNNTMVLAVAYDLSADKKYLRGVNRAMDYLMGNNAVRQSFVTGYGEFYETDLHDRLAWGAYPGTPYPRGWMAGGPLTENSGDPATPRTGPIAKRYAAKNTAPDAWGSKENTINWNAPLAWTASYVNLKAADMAAGPTDIVPPTVPQNVQVTASTSSTLSIRWDPSTDNVGVVGYHIFRDGVQIATVPGNVTTYTDTGLAPSTQYTYRVRAFDAAGAVSQQSAPIVGTTLPGDVNTPPTVPAGLVVTGTTTSSVSLAWLASTDNVGVAGYRVYRGGVLVASVPTTSYVDTGLAPATAYTYRVSAFDGAGLESAQSAAVTGTTGSGGPTGSVRVEYRNTEGTGGANDNQIRPHLRVANTGTSALSLSTVTVRYYFTRDGSASVNVFCDWAVVGCTNLRFAVVALPSPVTGADAYLEVSFVSGSVAAGGNTGDIQLRLAKSDWSNFNETNDYSRGTNTAYAAATQIPGYVNGTLTWGSPPV
jgi:chitodextrinase